MLLADVRDRKLYVELKFQDMESYALDRLRLGRASYYRYPHALVRARRSRATGGITA